MADSESSAHELGALTKPHPFYRQPQDPQQRIWRYMDFAKFVALIDSGSLYFPSARHLGDGLEGSVSLETQRRRALSAEDMAQQFLTVPESAPHEKMIRERLRQSATVFSRHLEWQGQWTFINCWHMNDQESAAMWKIYAASNQAIAIQSTFSRLHDCLEPHRRPPFGEPIISEVYYADYDTDVVRNDFHIAPFFYKRKSFAHEHELRAVVQQLPLTPAAWNSDGAVTASNYNTALQPPHGIDFKIDLKTLLGNIYVAPDAPNWLAGVTERVLSKYGLTIPVIKSGLNRPPAY